MVFYKPLWIVCLQAYRVIVCSSYSASSVSLVSLSSLPSLSYPHPSPPPPSLPHFCLCMPSLSAIVIPLMMCYEIVVRNIWKKLGFFLLILVQLSIAKLQYHHFGLFCVIEGKKSP